jgi:hypothetical protein
LEYRRKACHLALKHLVDIMDARVTTSDRVIAAVGRRYSVARPKVTKIANLHTTLSASFDAAAAAILETASSNEEDDEDLLSVRASLCNSHRPLDIRGNRPQDKYLHMVDIGSGPHSQLQRHASTKSNTGTSTSQ